MEHAIQDEERCPQCNRDFATCRCYDHPTSPRSDQSSGMQEFKPSSNRICGDTEVAIVIPPELAPVMEQLYAERDRLREQVRKLREALEEYVEEWRFFHQDETLQTGVTAPPESYHMACAALKESE
jgi:hypothetical protein